MNCYDVAVIGGGVVGCEIARRLTDYSLKIALIEKCADVAEGGASKANSGIIHAGFDCHTGTVKAKMNVSGSRLYPALCERLGVELINCGALVVGRKEDEEKLRALFAQGVANGVEGLEIVGRDVIEKYLPTAHKDIECALHAKTSSIISPYYATIAMAEEAALNGCEFYFNSKVEKIEREGGIYKITAGENFVFSKAIVNAAGAGCLEINRLVGAEEFPLRFARGEYMLLDLTEKNFAKCTIFPLPTKLGKGVLVSPTVHGNIILGPTAIDCEAEENVVSYEGLDYIRNNIATMADNVNYRKNIRVFAGNRVISGEDFIIEKSKKAENFIYLAGICSPGLSSAPAIALEVSRLVEELGFALKENTDFVRRKPYSETRHMSDDELNALIKENPSYGKIVCRCEKITEGEILEAIRSPLKPDTVDGIKRRVRAGMGRCQGGFCMPTVMELIAKERGVPLSKVTKCGGGSAIVFDEEDK